MAMDISADAIPLHVAQIAPTTIPIVPKRAYMYGTVYPNSMSIVPSAPMLTTMIVIVL